MANEEQRKAFAAYMGGGSSSTASAAQSVPQYPGPIANPAGQYLLNVLPSHPPPLGQQQGQGQGQSQGQSQLGGTQFMPAQFAPSGFTQLPHNYANQPAPSVFNAGWQLPGSNALSSVSTSIVGPISNVMAPGKRYMVSEMSRDKRTNEHFSYRHQTGETQPQVEEHTVPVLLCHTCSDCGQMRSAGYHRNHPVIPGKPIVTTPCRKCKRRDKKHYRSRATSYTRFRSCTADEPCDWPREPVHVDIGHGEWRGRRRSRDEIHASWRTDHLRSPVIREKFSRVNMGLRSVQRSPQRTYSSTARVRVSSLSPGRSRYDALWPPPDVVDMKPSRPNEPYPVSDEIWPPPDVVRTHSYRKQSPPRLSPRIIELSPSPPLARSRTTRAVYRGASQERRARSPARRSDSRIRMQSHPRPYRTVVPDHRVPLHSDENLTNDAGSDPVSILKPADMTYETSYRRRTSLRDSQQSTNVEIGGPRVQFAAERREEPISSDRPEKEKYEQHMRYESRSYVNAPASPPLDRMERLHIRRSSPSPQRAYEEIRIDRARRISPSPPRRYEEVRFHHVSVSPRRPQEAALRPPPSPPPRERKSHPGYRHVSRTRFVERRRSLTPPPNRKQVSLEDDETDSEDEERGSLVEVRSWKGIDENGQPATFFDERRKVRMIDQGSVGGSDFRPLTERLSARSYRDV